MFIIITLSLKPKCSEREFAWLV